MPAKFLTADLAAAIAKPTIPSVTTWNRLEGRPRADDFSRALRAELRDALWMVTRQWQLGELRGDDAGSPILTTVHLTTTRLRKYRPAGHAVEPFDDAGPLEADVERRPVALQQAGAEMGLDLRLLMGRQWLRMLAPLGDFSVEYRTAYPLHQPDPTAAADAPYCADARAWSGFAAVAGRRMDGGKLYQHLIASPAHHAWDGIAALTPHQAAVDALAARFVAWVERLIYQPPAESAWLPDRLEYQFACSAPQADGEKVLVAEGYHQGRLDWYSLDVDAAVTVLGAPSAPDPTQPKADTQTLLPTALTFDGMPNTRWWAFEDGRTNFGDIKPDTTDLAKLLLIEFGLIYANDWFLIPYTVPAGSIVRLRGIAVTNVFGERTWVEAAGRGDDDDWQRWAMFLSSTAGNAHQAADTSLLLLPTAPGVLEGAPLEEVLLVRDEVANMVWGIETTVPSPTGEGTPGREAARDTRRFFERDLARRLGAPPVPLPAAESARIRYQVMTSVPEHWIPFIPVHVPGDVREIQLQRAAMLRILEGAPPSEPPVRVEPRSALLREGREVAPPVAYYVHEEEVPRAGVRVTQRFQRTRWHDGRAWVWLGARKQTGRGESSSGLAFDVARDIPPKAP